MRSTMPMAVIMMLIGTVPAGAESTSQALEKFGFTGIWSYDCAKDIEDPCTDVKDLYAGRCGMRIKINIPVLGNVTTELSRSTFKGGEPNRSTTEIVSAERLTESKLRLATIAQEDKQQPPRKLPAWARLPGEVWEIVIEKYGNGNVRVISSKRKDGKKLGARDGKLCEPKNPEETNENAIEWVCRWDREVPAMEKCLK